MSLKWLVEETVTQGLNELQERVSGEMEYVLKEMMYSATGHEGNTTAPIPKRLMHEGTKGIKEYEYNPWLYMSGQQSEYWTVDIEKGKSSVTANYSGMRGFHSKGEFKVWAEFSEEWEDEPYLARRMDPYERTLARDYAFYQETGEDMYAGSEDAAHIGFVSRGMEEAAGKQIPYTLERQIERILRRL